MRPPPVTVGAEPASGTTQGRREGHGDNEERERTVGCWNTRTDMRYQPTATYQRLGAIHRVAASELTVKTHPELLAPLPASYPHLYDTILNRIRAKYTEVMQQKQHKALPAPTGRRSSCLRTQLPRPALLFPAMKSAESGITMPSGVPSSRSHAMPALHRKKYVTHLYHQRRAQKGL